MEPTETNPIRILVERIRSRALPFQLGRTPKASRTPSSRDDISDPVMNYYKHRLNSNLSLFTRFALQSRSIRVRDIFAKVATRGRYDLSDLLSTLEAFSTGEDPRRLRWTGEEYDPSILLALAFYIANTTRGDIDTHAATKIYDFVHASYGDSVFTGQHKLQYVEALADSGRYKDVEKFAERFAINELAPLQSELLEVQRLRQDGSSEAQWLRAMNRLYESLKMTPIQLSAEPWLPVMDRLHAKSSHKISGPKVSVLVPTYSPGPSIRTAIRSLLEQSWENLEILVVDDASPDEYRPLFDELSQIDSRVRIIRQPRNTGAYLARNAGLAEASGKYVTTHDDDDWSHPDKIASQVAIMEKNASIVATTSAHIRTTENMDFQRINVRVQYIQLNYSSLMFRKEITDKLGPWDSVNRGGDSEFIARLTHYYGEACITHVGDRPLSFSRVRSGSLTSGEMFRGYFADSRLLYGSAFRQWHLQYPKNSTLPPRLNGKRPFAVPTSFEPGTRNKDLGHFDVIYVSDFFRQSHSVKFAIRDMEALAVAGYRVGYMHLQSPQTNRLKNFPRHLFEMQLADKITQLSPNDRAKARLLIVYDASIGMFADQITSFITAKKGLVVHRESPAAYTSEVRSPTLLSHAINELDRVFRTMFVTVGATSTDQQRLRCALPTHRILPSSLIWDIHTDQEPTPPEPLNGKPTVGFHTFEGSQYRWPASEELFRKVYVSTDYQTLLYGALGTARSKFTQEVLGQVETVNVGEWDEKSFLRHIDFWVYYPHERLQDQVWAPVLNAMQAGKVVILPPRLESLYRDAAVYAKPAELPHVITDFSRNSTEYVAQARRGQDLVSQKYTPVRFLERIRAVIPSPEQELE